MKPHSFRAQEGQSAVLIALVMVVIVAGAGLVIDGGREYMQRRQSQNASDGASFAGTSELALSPKPGGPADDDRIKDRVNAFALNNGIASTDHVRAWYMDPNGSVLGVVGTGTVPSGATRVRVETDISFEPFLIRILNGGGPVTTQTKSAGRVGLLKKMGKLMPVTIPVEQVPAYGQPAKLQGQKFGPGGFQWLNFFGPTDTDYSIGRKCPSPDTPTLASRLNPYDDTPIGAIDLDDGVYMCSNPGEHSSKQVRDSLDAWLNDFEAGDRLWPIPIHDQVIGEGNNLKYHIVAFAIFDFSGWDFQGHNNGESCPTEAPGNKCLIGRFVKYVKLGDIDEETQCNLEGKLGICGNELIE